MVVKSTQVRKCRNQPVLSARFRWPLLIGLYFFASPAFAQDRPPSPEDGWVVLESGVAASPAAPPSDDGRRDLDNADPQAPSTLDGWQDLESLGTPPAGSETPPADDPNSWIDIEAELSQVNAAAPLPTGRLSAGEIVDITVAEADSLSGAFKISSIGTLELPLIGAIRAEGLTAQELKNQLEALYSVDYLVDPDITVSTRAKVLGEVSVKGRVNRPQALSMTSVESLAKIIARSGGVSGDKSNLDAIILRSVSDTIRARRVSLTSLDVNDAPGPTILPGDQITVIERTNLPEIKDNTGEFPLLDTVLGGKALPKF